MGMNENHQQLIQLGNRILNASRNELYLSMRFLDIPLSALGYEMNLSSMYVGTDGVKILFNPRYLIQRYSSDRILVNRLYLHMLLHCILRHPFHLGNREERLWHLACDIAVESIIDSLPSPAIHLTVSDRREDTYLSLRQELTVLSAEGIYRVIEKKSWTEQEFGKLQLEFWVDDHVFWEKKKEEEEEQEQQEQDKKQDQEEEQEQEEQDSSQRQQALEAHWQEISEKVETNLETFSREFGEEAGEMMQVLKVENREKYDYRSFLQKFTTLKEDMRMDEDSFDYVFYTYGLSLYGNMPLLEALEYKESKKVEELVIAIDTSESCDGAVVEGFLSETFAILKNSQSFFHTFNVRILQSDMKIQSDTKITTLEELEDFMAHFTLKGSGGTDFRPVFAYVNQLIEEKAFQSLKGLLYFTDGYGTFPKQRPAYDTAFIFLQEEYHEVSVPPWAMKVVLGPEDLILKQDDIR